MATRKRKNQKSGSQLNRSETVTVRLDPKLNYLCELAARSQRRTKSSLIEAALVEALNIVPIDPRPSNDEQRTTIAQLAETLWHVDEVTRLVRLVTYASHLMTYDEQKIWATIVRNGFFWHGHWELYGTEEGIFIPDNTPDKLILHRIEEHWESIKAVVAGDQPVSTLPQAVFCFPWDDRMIESTMAPPSIEQPQTDSRTDG